MRPKSTLAQRGGFSLVEMLVVLTIMGILSALTVSSFGVLRSTSLTLAGNNVVDVFAMARQNSIAKNDFTAVVIQTQGTAALTSYCVIDLARDANGNFGSWTQVSPWRYLPKGVIFENNQPSVDTYMQGTGTSTLPSALPTSFPFQGSQVDLTSASYVVQCYQPDGTLVGGQPLRLRLIEGAADATGNIAYQGSTSSGTQVSYYDVYFVANTGLTKIARN
jgi:prepilin-type N-terminal cleavage/methylation domain-containing protein